MIALICIFDTVPGNAEILTYEPNVQLYPDPVMLRGIYGPNFGRRGVSVETITNELFRGYPVLHVLSGPFHHDTSFALGSLTIVEGKALAPPSGRPNRPAVYQLTDGTIGIRNEQAVLTRHRSTSDVLLAIGAGPWLVDDRVNYRFAASDPLYQSARFNRHTYRCGVGLTASGRFFTAASYGTLEEFRDQTRITIQRDYQEQVAQMMNLDGGHTADFDFGSDVDIPLRLVIFQNK